MPELDVEKSGGRVFMVSSLDPDHLGENVLDSNDRTYWISTGLYPQEILLELGQPANVSSVRLSATRVRHVRFEACQEEAPVNFKLLAEGELDDAGPGRLQVRDLATDSQDGPTEYLRLVILSGWDDFCSVHRIQINGVVVDRPPRSRSKESKAFLSQKTRESLEVKIPEHRMVKSREEKHEPDAPRQPDHASPWRAGEATGFENNVQDS
mmetsp:Transcript_92783/g.198952  ORF Transcript_92783/g.198952 Transcript_92783/m.198952 type:complete len:210 (-) Transcript_92783:41-670(-)